ncbi:hypothetical protein DPQ25_11190 [Hydrogeniiclostridium mannosilyticum]|uniref:Uncharacterized protein n=1 Tax=Hydrogeniiclostridium mannosilyticum TaxID=2764322 RepID=A0A328UGF9_9FIRM|nr:hypothetical protein DPQ25_11190 [Hydrogeniiclostridium mannosilyticum]
MNYSVIPTQMQLLIFYLCKLIWQNLVIF